MTLKFIPFEQDHFFSRFGNILPWDKIEHIIREILLYMSLSYFLDNALALFITELFGIGYEIKDGYLNDGFSVIDLLANQIGICIGLLLRLVI